MAVAVWRRWPAAGVGVALAAMIAFLPTAGEGMAQFARARSVRPITEALVRRLAPTDRVVHEGALENSASLLLALRRPVHVVEGLQSNLAFGATFPEARDVFWSATRLRAGVGGTGPLLPRLHRRAVAERGARRSRPCTCWPRAAAAGSTATARLSRAPDRARRGRVAEST